MTGDIITSAGYSLNAALAHFWRGLAPVARAYTAFGLGTVAPTVRTPSWGSMVCDYTTATSTRGGGAFTPVDQTTWGARHRMRFVQTGTQTGQIGGVGCKLSGGADIYWWALASFTWYRWHETAGVPGSVSLITTPPATPPDYDVEVFVPARATEATAGTCTVKLSGDGFTTSHTVDSLSIAPAATGLAGSNNTTYGTLLAESWSAS